MGYSYEQNNSRQPWIHCHIQLSMKILYEPLMVERNATRIVEIFQQTTCSGFRNVITEVVTKCLENRPLSNQSKTLQTNVSWFFQSYLFESFFLEI